MKKCVLMFAAFVASMCIAAIAEKMDVVLDEKAPNLRENSLENLYAQGEKITSLEESEK